MELFELTAHELRDLLRKREISVMDITESTLGRIAQVEDKVNSYITVLEDTARKMAADAQKRLDSGEPTPDLLGIPTAPKDNMCTTGITTTCGSKILADWKPPYDSTAVAKLRDAGSVFVGKANLDEFAMGSSTEYSAFKISRTPWDLDRVAGGSSGGSASAVASGEAVIALGSDTGGSIRLPASYCGVVGMKPTYGRVSRYGLVAYASSLDQIGPFAKDVTDCALVLNAICGWDGNDSSSVKVDVPDFTKALTGDVKGMKIGLVKEMIGEGTDPEVKDAVMKALNLLESQGAIIEETTLPSTDYALPAYYILAPAECSSNLARYDAVRFGMRKLDDSHVSMTEQTRGAGFGWEVKQRIMIGTYTLSAGYYDAYYLKAQKVRTLIRQDFDRAFEKYDVLVSPVCPSTSFKIGEKVDDPMAMKLMDVCTIPVNLAGLPALSVPCGFKDHLPIGLHMIGKPFDEASLLRAAYTYEQNTDWHKRRAKIG